MDLPPDFVLTSTVAALRDFLTRSGTRHSFLVGDGGSGKTTALYYLASSLSAENHLVVMVPLGQIDTGDDLVVTIARAVLDQSTALGASQNSQADDPLDQIRAQFDERFTVSQRLSGASPLIDRLIELVIERGNFRPHGYIFLDGLDEMRQAGDAFYAIEDLAEHLESASLVVASRQSPVISRLQSRSAFDIFELSPLTQAESMEFLRRKLSEPTLQQINFSELVSVSNGSPLLLSILAAQVWESGTLPSVDRTDTLGTLLGRVFAQRLGTDQAGMDAKLFLTLLAFLQPVSTARLTQIAGLPPERSQSALQELSRSGVVSVSDIQIAFAHVSLAEYHLENNVITHDIDINAFQFGDAAAERDTLLEQNFMPPRDMHFITSGAKTIVLGDRGAGKSAIFLALQELNKGWTAPENAVRPRTIISVSKNPASFVQQMTADDSATSSADGFKAVWLLYCAALAACEADATTLSDAQNTRAFVKDSRAILRRIGWTSSIKGEGRISRLWTIVRSVIPEKVTLTLGPVTVEPNLKPHERGWLGNNIRIDEFIDRIDRLLQSNNRQLLIVFDQIDEAFKYQRDRQEALVQGLFLAESFLSLKQAIRLVVLLRTDLFELYNIQEKNKFVSRTVRLGWSRDELRKQLLQRLFSNSDLRTVMESVQGAALPLEILAQIQFQIVFPTKIEGKPFDEWLFENLKNGKDQVAPRQIILFLNLTKDNAKNDAGRRRIPLFREKEVADAMTSISELSYQEVITDFRVATEFVRNCRAGKVVEFELEKVQTLFEIAEGSVALQIERLERLGFLTRIIVREGNSLLPRFRIPRLFTRCWETSD